jgi:hypothetical protein
VAEPPEKQLSILSFAMHATRGVIRDQSTRRKTMFVVLVVALVLLFSGSTFLQSNLNPRSDKKRWESVAQQIVRDGKSRFARFARQRMISS